MPYVTLVPCPTEGFYKGNPHLEYHHILFSQDHAVSWIKRGIFWLKLWKKPIKCGTQPSNISNLDQFLRVCVLEGSILPGVCLWTLGKVKCCLWTRRRWFHLATGQISSGRVESKGYKCQEYGIGLFICFALKHSLIVFFFFQCCLGPRENDNKQFDLALTSRSCTQHCVKSSISAHGLKHCSKHSLANLAPGEEQPLEQCRQFNRVAERRKPEEALPEWNVIPKSQQEKWKPGWGGRKATSKMAWKLTTQLNKLSTR